MKKIGSIVILSGLFMFTTTACNNPNVEQETTITKSEKTVVISEKETDGGSSPEKKNSKPEHLTAETFKEKIWDYEKNPDAWVYEGDKPCMIDFYADWCRPCKMVAPIMDELAEEYKGQIYVYKIDTQVQRELAQLFQVTSIPRVLFVPATGQPQMSVGALPKPTFVQAIEEVLLAE